MRKILEFKFWIRWPIMGSGHLILSEEVVHGGLTVFIKYNYIRLTTHGCQ